MSQVSPQELSQCHTCRRQAPLALFGKLVPIWERAETFPVRLCAREETLRECPQQFGPKTLLRAAAKVCGDTNDFKGNKST